MYLGKSLHHPPKIPRITLQDLFDTLANVLAKLKHHLTLFVIHQSAHEVGVDLILQNSPNDSMSEETGPTVSPRLSRTVLSL